MTLYENVRGFLARHPIRMPDTTPEPVAGQVWRATWDDAVADIYITRAHDDTVRFLPITAYSPAIANPLAYLSADESPLGYASAVWREDEREIPIFVLDGCFGSVAEIQVEPPSPPQSDLSEAARAADPGWQLQLSMERQLDDLAAATWIPQGQPVGPIRDLLRDAGLTLRQLSQQVSMPEDLLVRINTSSWWLNQATASSLSDALGVPVTSLPHRAPFATDPELPRAINAPARRASFRQKSLREGITEAQVRFAAANELLLAAARRSAPGVSEHDKWNHFLDMYFEATSSNDA